jgi:hypothetical protein
MTAPAAVGLCVASTLGATAAITNSAASTMEVISDQLTGRRRLGALVSGREIFGGDAMVMTSSTSGR